MEALHLFLNAVKTGLKAGCQCQIRVSWRVRATSSILVPSPLGDGMRIRELRLEVGDHAI